MVNLLTLFLFRYIYNSTIKPCTFVLVESDEEKKFEIHFCLRVFFLLMKHSTKMAMIHLMLNIGMTIDIVRLFYVLLLAILVVCVEFPWARTLCDVKPAKKWKLDRSERENWIEINLSSACWNVSKWKWWKLCTHTHNRRRRLVFVSFVVFLISMTMQCIARNKTACITHQILVPFEMSFSKRIFTSSAWHFPLTVQPSRGRNKLN